MVYWYCPEIMNVLYLRGETGKKTRQPHTWSHARLSPATNVIGSSIRGGSRIVNRLRPIYPFQNSSVQIQYGTVQEYLQIGSDGNFYVLHLYEAKLELE